MEHLENTQEICIICTENLYPAIIIAYDNIHSDTMYYGNNTNIDNNLGALCVENLYPVVIIASDNEIQAVGIDITGPGETIIEEDDLESLTTIELSGTSNESSIVSSHNSSRNNSGNNQNLLITSLTDNMDSNNSAQNIKKLWTCEQCAIKIHSECMDTWMDSQRLSETYKCPHCNFEYSMVQMTINPTHNNRVSINLGSRLYFCSKILQCLGFSLLIFIITSIVYIFCAYFIPLYYGYNVNITRF
tara:strand:+ start:587 stop:1324 length:738 start_codon:yes stop_codon:yes gene_type:complete